MEDSEPRERPLRDGARSPFDRAFDREKHALIQEALTRINPSFREAVVLRDLEDLSYEEIAEILQISIGTVRAAYYAAGIALRTQLSAQLSPEFQLRECI